MAATSNVVKILYRNHRGEVAVRTIAPGDVWFGATDWHPERQWLLEAHDCDKDAMRDFAMTDILAWGEEAVAAYQSLVAARQVAREEGQRGE